MKRINRKPTNEEEYISVALGMVHNVGAGGTKQSGCRATQGVNFNLLAGKRFGQWCARVDRAVGERR